MSPRQGHNDDKQRVRDASDIVDIVGDVVNLKPKGREFAGLCPFHDDHNPSMSVVPSKQMFHCFVCQAGGDVFTFVQKFHRVEFREALEILADRAGIELTKFNPGGDPSQAPQGPSRTDLATANATASTFFQSILTHPEHGTEARALIKRRGITPEMVERFAIGASPDRWDGLCLTIDRTGLARQDFLEAGLLKQRDSGGEYDALRNRLIFPITDQVGRTIAFGGRRIDDEDEPKYLNSPETRLFNKSGTLYGLAQASRAIQRARTGVVVEGYTDVIACHQAGVENVVATLGTALTPGHARILARLCDTVVLLFDGDDAGQRAAKRAVEVFFTERLDLKIASLATVTDLKDPDELLKSPGGVELFGEAINNARDLLSYLFDDLTEQLAGQGMAARQRIITDWLAWLGRNGWANLKPIRRRLIMKRLAEVTGLDEQTIRAALPGGRSGASVEQPTQRTAQIGAHDAVLGCLLSDGSLWLTLSGSERDLIRTELYQSEAARAAVDAAHRIGADGINPSLEAVLNELADEELDGGNAEQLIEAKQWAAQLCERVNRMTGEDAERRSLLLSDSLRKMHDEVALSELSTNAERASTDAAALAAFLTKRKELDAKLGGNRSPRLAAE